MSSEFPAPQRVSPRRRYHRPAAEFLGARCQVPVLAGLPRVDEEPKRAEFEMTETTASGQETTEFEAPIARVDRPDENQPENQQPVAPEQVAGSTHDIPEAKKVTLVSAIRSAATSGRLQKWAYPMAGTLIAGLLIYTAVFGLKTQNREFWGSQTAGWEATPNDDSASAPVAQITRAMPKTDEQELAQKLPVALESAGVSLETTSQPLDEPLGELVEQPLEQHVAPPLGESLEEPERKSAAFEPSVDTMPAETQIPWAATESAESLTNTPEILPIVIASAPTHGAPTEDAPAQDMPAEEQILDYPTTNFSDELPVPQAIPRRPTIFSESPVLAPPVPGIQPAFTPGRRSAPPPSLMGTQAQSYTYGQPSVPGNRQGQTLGQRHLGPVYSQPQMPNYTGFTPGVYGPGQQSMEQVRLNGNIEPFPTMKR